MASCGTLTVSSEFDPGAVDVVSCPSPPSMAPGDTTQITVDVSNPNDSDAETTIILAAKPAGAEGNENNIILSETLATIPPGGESRTTTLQAPDAGEYELLAYTANVSEATTSTATLQDGIGQRVAGVDTGTLATAGAGLGAVGLSTLGGWG